MMPYVYNLKTHYKVEFTKQLTKEKKCIERRFGQKDLIAHSIPAINKQTSKNFKVFLLCFVFKF